ncbi:hypothetical protein [Mesorhizobium sp. M0674]|uniref:hypothetical protein n=1 Tax=unclassified Mesorhizobium TaxID=325217 RepID=UPI00333B1901
MQRPQKTSQGAASLHLDRTAIVGVSAEENVDFLREQNEIPARRSGDADTFTSERSALQNLSQPDKTSFAEEMK